MDYFLCFNNVARVFLYGAVIIESYYGKLPLRLTFNFFIEDSFPSMNFLGLFPFISSTPSLALLAILISGSISQSMAEPFDPAMHQKHARTYSPEESMGMIDLAPGYRLELVAAEPLIEEPATMAWDGDGKLYVAELNTYMQEIDGKNQHDPVCRVVLLEDTDNDGRMDKRSVFVDGSNCRV